MSKIMAAAILVLVPFAVSAAGTRSKIRIDSASFRHQVKEAVKKASKKDSVAASSEKTILSYQDLMIKRLDSLEKTVPMPYNEHVRHYIELYSQKARGKISRALGLSEYYFPIYEKIFREQHIPDEIKYLSIVESSLNPYAVSRVGATGLWQFMYTTGKMYGLTINSWLDERKDPLASSKAAAAYLNDAYDQFGDWLLAIASYNCGAGNVRRAISRAGGKYDYWAIRRYLPRETQNYIPAYIATAYLMKYHKKYGIEAVPADFNVRTELLQISSKVSLRHVAEAIDVNPKELALLNPAYLKQTIYGSADAPRLLVIPEIDHSYYEDLYSALNLKSDDERPQIISAAYRKQAVKPGFYKVKSGDKLLAIARKFDIEVQDIKVWNNLKQNVIVPGQTLRVAGTPPAVLRSAEYITYKVQPGDTLLKIAQKFQGVTVNGLKTVNSLNGSDLKPGLLLKIVKG